MSHTPDPRPPACPPVCLTVFRLHWWSHLHHSTELFRTYASALASLATSVRDHWADIDRKSVV